MNPIVWSTIVTGRESEDRRDFHFPKQFSVRFYARFVTIDSRLDSLTGIVTLIRSNETIVHRLEQPLTLKLTNTVCSRTYITRFLLFHSNTRENRKIACEKDLSLFETSLMSRSIDRVDAKMKDAFVSLLPFRRNSQLDVYSRPRGP